jgi:hypothetical protein
VGEACFPDWLFLLRGTKTLIGLLGDATSDGPLSVLFARYAKRWEAVHPETCLPSSEQTALDEMQSLLEHNVTDQTALGIYLRAIKELRGYFHICATTNSHASLDVTDLFIWIHEVIDDFIPLLQVPTQEALAVFASFCVLLRRLEFHCWVEGWADHLIGEIQRLIDEEHKSWIQWPVMETVRHCDGC